MLGARQTHRWLLVSTMALAGCVGSPLRVEPAAPVASTGDSGVGAGEAGGGGKGGAASIDSAWRDPQTWPKRFGRGRPGTLGIVEPMTGPVMAMRQGEDQKRAVEKEMLDDLTKLMNSRGRGWFRGVSSLTVKGEGKGAFVFTTDPAADPKRVKSPTEPALYYKYISGARDDSGELVRMQRTWFAYYDPVGYGPFDQVPARECPGVVVILPGIFGTPASVVNQTIHALRAHGWAVLRMLSHPSRFTENATFVVGDSDIEASAKSIAEILTDRAAECAYAIEDMVPVIVEQRPYLKGKKRVALGMSGGAMVLPTVVARNPDAYAGAVIIAGGSDFLSVALESNYTAWIDALRFLKPGGESLKAGESKALVAAYRRLAPLDSLHTATSLRGKPVLMLHGTEDLAVPAHLGDELWEAAGRPERWSYDAGHEMLFLGLPLQLDRIVHWMAEHLGGDGAAVPGAPKPEIAPPSKPEPAGT